MRSRSVSPAPIFVVSSDDVQEKPTTPAFTSDKPIRTRSKKEKKRHSHGVEVKATGKTYFGGFFNKLAKSLPNQLPMSKTAKYVLDEMMYDIFDRMMTTASEFHVPNMRKKGKFVKGVKKQTIKRRDVDGAVRLMMSPGMYKVFNEKLQRKSLVST